MMISDGPSPSTKHLLFFLQGAVLNFVAMILAIPCASLVQATSACPTAQTDRQDNGKSSFSRGNALGLVDFPLSC